MGCSPLGPVPFIFAEMLNLQLHMLSGRGVWVPLFQCNMGTSMVHLLAGDLGILLLFGVEDGNLVGLVMEVSDHPLSAHCGVVPHTPFGSIGV